MKSLLDNAERLGKIFRDEMKNIKSDMIELVRGKGLLNAVVIRPKGGKTAWDVCLAMKDKGLIAKPTHDHIIRFAPPQGAGEIAGEQIDAPGLFARRHRSVVHALVADERLEEIGDLGGGILGARRHGRTLPLRCFGVARHSSEWGVRRQDGELEELVFERTRQHLHVGRGIGVGEHTDVQMTAVRHHRDVDGEVLGERHDRVHLEHLGAEAVERHLRAGHVGDHEVHERLRVHRTRREPEDRGRRVLGQVQQRGRAQRLLALLEIRRARAHRVEPLAWVPLSYRDRHEHQGEPVAELHVLAVVAHRHGAHDLHHQIVVQLATRLEQAGERAADGREHDVVHGAAERVPNRLGDVERHPHQLEAASRPDARIQRKARRERVAPDERAERAREPSDLVDDLLGSVGRVLARAQDARRLGDPLAHGVEHQARGVGRRFRHPRRRVEHRRLGREVEEHGRDVDAGDAVGQRVMRLVDEADVLTVVEALHEPELPERPVAVEELAHEPLGQREQVPATAGLRQLREVDVARDVEAVVVDPHGIPDPERHVHDPLAEPGNEVQA